MRKESRDVCFVDARVVWNTRTGEREREREKEREKKERERKRERERYRQREKPTCTAGRKNMTISVQAILDESSTKDYIGTACCACSIGPLLACFVCCGAFRRYGFCAGLLSDCACLL